MKLNLLKHLFFIQILSFCLNSYGTFNNTVSLEQISSYKPNEDTNCLVLQNRSVNWQVSKIANLIRQENTNLIKGSNLKLEYTLIKPIINQNINLVNSILSYYPNLNLLKTNEYGLSPLHYALKTKNKVIIKLIIDYLNNHNKHTENKEQKYNIRNSHSLVSLLKQYAYQTLDIKTLKKLQPLGFIIKFDKEMYNSISNSKNNIEIEQLMEILNSNKITYPPLIDLLLNIIKEKRQLIFNHPSSTEYLTTVIDFFIKINIKKSNYLVDIFINKLEELKDNIDEKLALKILSYLVIFDLLEDREEFTSNLIDKIRSKDKVKLGLNNILEEKLLSLEYCSLNYNNLNKKIIYYNLDHVHNKIKEKLNDSKSILKVQDDIKAILKNNNPSISFDYFVQDSCFVHFANNQEKTAIFIKPLPQSYNDFKDIFIKNCETTNLTNLLKLKFLKKIGWKLFIISTSEWNKKAHEEKLKYLFDTKILDVNSMLIEAIKNNSLGNISLALTKGANLAYTDKTNLTPLHYAFNSNNKNIVDLILANISTDTSQNVNSLINNEEKYQRPIYKDLLNYALKNDVNILSKFKISRNSANAEILNIIKIKKNIIKLSNKTVSLKELVKMLKDIAYDDKLLIFNCPDFVNLWESKLKDKISYLKNKPEYIVIILQCYVNLNLYNSNLIPIILNELSTKLYHLNNYQIVNLLWSLAVLNINTNDIIDIVNNSLKNFKINIEELLNQDTTFLHKFVVAIEYYKSNYYCDDEPDITIEKAKSIIKSNSTVCKSSSQKNIVRYLNKNNINVEEEYWIDSVCSNVDMAIPDKKIAIEYDGPTHFCNYLKNDTVKHSKEYNLKSLFKTKLLELNGWKVIRIPYFKDKSNKSRILLLKFIKEKLEQDIIKL